MFGGVADGTEVRQEPLLDDDVVMMASTSQALLKVRFSAIAAKKIKQWKKADSSTFTGLELALKRVGESPSKLQSSRTALSKRTGRRTFNRRSRRRMRSRWANNSGHKKDARLEEFVKAAKFVRGRGAAAIHPGAKIQLHGLLMQAQRGDCKSRGSLDPSARSAVGAMASIKKAAWKALKGRTQEEAMQEYIALLTSLAPNWRVAHILAARESEEERRKPRQMMWVLKVTYEDTLLEKARVLSQGRPTMAGAHMDMKNAKHRNTNLAYARGLTIKAIEVLQSSSEVNSELWTEEEDRARSSRQMKRKLLRESLGANAYVQTLVKDVHWTLEDCVIDKGKYNTLAEQREAVAVHMRDMAKGEQSLFGCGRREGGRCRCSSPPPPPPPPPPRHPDDSAWTFYDKTAQPGVKAEDQLDVYEREVDWSNASQLRTAVETGFTIENIFESLVGNFAKETGFEKSYADESTRALNKADASSHFVFVAKAVHSITALNYREIHFPWPRE